MIRHRGLIAHCAVARVLEEIYRLLRGGSARRRLRTDAPARHPAGAVPRGRRPAAPERHRRGTHGVPGRSGRPATAQAATPAAANEQADAAGNGRRRSRPAAATAEADPRSTRIRHPTENARPDAESDEDPGRNGRRGRHPAVDEHAAALTLLEQLELTERKDIKQAVKQLWALLAALDELVRGTDRPPNEPLLLGALLSPLAINVLREEKRIGQQWNRSRSWCARWPGASMSPDGTGSGSNSCWWASGAPRTSPRKPAPARLLRGGLSAVAAALRSHGQACSIATRAERARPTQEAPASPASAPLRSPAPGRAAACPPIRGPSRIVISRWTNRPQPDKFPASAPLRGARPGDESRCHGSTAIARESPKPNPRAPPRRCSTAPA